MEFDDVIVMDKVFSLEIIQDPLTGGLAAVPPVVSLVAGHLGEEDAVAGRMHLKAAVLRLGDAMEDPAPEVDE